MLTEGEIIKHARKYADAMDRVDDFDEETKAYVGERRGQRKKLMAVAKEHRTATMTGRATREVQCAEYVSFEQNRKWVERLDTKEVVEERPLSGAERQAELPLEEVDTGQLSLDEIDRTSANGGGDEGDDESDRDRADIDASSSQAEPDSTTNITDPDEVLGVAKGRKKKSSKARRGAR